MKAVLDVHYEANRAVAACVLFTSWQDSAPADLLQVVVSDPLPYGAGRFYLRELPSLLSLLDHARCKLATIVIDGYVHLQAGKGRGLGTHLYEALSGATAVVGVAKNHLKIADRFVPIYRGRSRKPLYISAIGCPVEQAARQVAGMHGPYRIPTLLKMVDQYARGTSGTHRTS